MRASQLLGSTLLLVAMAGYGQSDPAQAAPAQPDTAALMQKIRDLEDRVIAMEGQIRQLKSQPAPPAQPAATPVPNAEAGTQAVGPQPQVQPPAQAAVASDGV